MKVYNHNGVEFGEVKQDSDGYVTFHPTDDWTPGYSAYQLKEIAAKMIRL